ncbi:heterokaryon incompatibility protein-domain-containing protein [Nemania sp. FL0031]|nr:heterokaryon incompatibility protein-domain-containing protein [Nemania sp. FL0031]
MESRSCVICQRAFHERQLGNPWLHHQPSDLVNGVLIKCWWCMKIMYNFKLAIKDDELTMDDFQKSYPDFKTTVARDEEYFHVQCFSSYLDSTSQLLDDTYPYDDVGCLFECAEIHETDVLPRRILGQSTNSKESFNFISEQIQICRESHPRCQSGSANWYPTRLLQMTSLNGTIELRIVERDETTLIGPYITLSHSWGGQQPLQLTTNNKVEFKKSISLDRVPDLYKDSIDVALGLEIQYIWIDSLCIMQDSREDWRRESATMSFVYQNGLFNIEAVSSNNCHYSMFALRDPLLLYPHIVQMGTLNEPRYEKWTENDDEYWATGGFVEEEILYGRGWVLQERLLAIRSVMFTKKQIFYRCAEGFTSEIGGLKHFPVDTRRGYSLFRNLSTASLTKENCFELWRLVIHKYSLCALTVPGDKLVAIAGIARMFGNVRRSRYLAGLWEHTLLEDLLWYRSGDSYQRPADYRAPTWSWASVNTVEHREERNVRHKPCTECLLSVPTVVEVSTNLVGTDEYGEVQGGRLVLNGYLYPILESQSGNVGQHNPTDPKTWKAHIEKAMKDLFPEFRDEVVKILIFTDYDEGNQNEGMVLNECFIMPLLHERENAYPHKIEGLLLAANTPAWGVYQRIGMFRIEGGILTVPLEERFGIPKEPETDELGARLVARHDHEICRPTSEMMQAFMEVMGDRGSQVPSHQRDCHGRHTITIT